ncbi:hypothetical protein Csa_023758, partial [Cucumis sativus]
LHSKCCPLNALNDSKVKNVNLSKGTGQTVKVKNWTKQKMQEQIWLEVRI